jgi:hypothetical protein
MQNLKIKPSFVNIFKQKDLEEGVEPVFLYALRHKYTNKLIDVAYSEEGLKWATVSRKVNNAVEHKYIYYVDAKPEVVVDRLETRIVDGLKIVKPHKRMEFVGDLSPNPKYVVEYPFVPRNHEVNGKFHKNNQLREITFSRKALKLLMDQVPYLRALRYREARDKGVKKLAA